MNINKVIFRSVKIAFVVMIVLLVAYGIMRVSFAAYEYGYRLAIESLIDTPESTEGAESTEGTEGTESTEGTGE